MDVYPSLHFRCSQAVTLSHSICDYDQITIRSRQQGGWREELTGTCPLKHTLQECPGCRLFVRSSTFDKGSTFAQNFAASLSHTRNWVLICHAQRWPEHSTSVTKQLACRRQRHHHIVDMFFTPGACCSPPFTLLCHTRWFHLVPGIGVFMASSVLSSLAGKPRLNQNITAWLCPCGRGVGVGEVNLKVGSVVITMC